MDELAAELLFGQAIAMVDEGRPAGDVRISTQSPFWSGVFKGTSLPFTRAPTHRPPTSEWMR